MSLLSCENLTVKYGSRLAVENVSFTLNEGDYMCVVGENGSGKSTLLKCILGLVRPYSGKISFSGVDTDQIGYLPQQTDIKNDFPASAIEVVLSGRLNRRGFRPFYTKNDKKEAMGRLRNLGADELYDKTFRELSGGQKQRVLLARALCSAEKLIALDEPAAGFDCDCADEMYDLLDKLNRDSRLTILMISHDITRAVKRCDKILHMRTSPLYFGPAAGYEESHGHL